MPPKKKRARKARISAKPRKVSPFKTPTRANNLVGFRKELAERAMIEEAIRTGKALEEVAKPRVELPPFGEIPRELRERWAEMYDPFSSANMLGSGISSLNMAVYLPEDYDALVPPKGAWILLHEVASQFLDQVQPYEIYWAIPDDYAPQGIDGRIQHRVKIRTTVADLWLWPYEYKCVSNIDTYVNMSPKEVSMVLLDESDRASGQLSEQMCYIMSRGIRRADAMRMLAGQMESPTHFFFRCHGYGGFGLSHRYWHANQDRIKFA